MNPKSINQLQYRSEIDGLRAVAVLSVLGFHASPNWVKGGFIGVDIFFVISGYLISLILLTNLENQSFSFLEFYKKRIIRIFPALLLVLLTTCAIGWFLLLPEQYKQLGKHIAASAIFISNFALWNESGYFDNAATTKPLLHLWSLGIEEQFYIFCPFLLWTLSKYKNKLFITISSVALVSFSLNILLINTDPIKVFYSPQTRFWELLVGVLVAITSFRWSSAPDTEKSNNFSRKLMVFFKLSIVKNLISIVGLLSLVVAITLISEKTPFPGWWALLPVLGAALLVMPNENSWVNKYILSNRILVWFGLISYPLYLWHIPILFFFRAFRVEDGISRADRLIAVLMSVLLAWLTYRFIERPIRFGKINKSITTIALCSLMIIMGLFGVFIYQTDGYGQRFKGITTALTGSPTFNYYSQIRSSSCHMEGGGSTNASRNISCYETQRPLVALWGDSTAASLYPGLKKLQGNSDFGISQLTNGGCPPILNAGDIFENKACGYANKSILEELQKQNPNVLVLSAAWRHEGGYRWTISELKLLVTSTIKLIEEKLPNTRIILIGPVPFWEDSPQQSAFQYFRNLTDKRQPIPIRLHAEELKSYDSVLRDVALSTGVTFISANDIFCTEEGCISRIGDTPEDFVAINSEHLSARGAEFFINSVKDIIFSNGRDDLPWDFQTTRN